MKKILVILLLNVTINSFAETVPFPTWVTVPEIKIMTIKKFISIMENYPQTFYQLKDIQLSNSEDGDAKIMKVSLLFDTPKCKQRVFKGLFYSTLCKDQGCLIVTALDQCDGVIANEQNFIHKSDI